MYFKNITNIGIDVDGSGNIDILKNLSKSSLDIISTYVVLSLINTFLLTFKYLAPLNLIICLIYALFKFHNNEQKFTESSKGDEQTTAATGESHRVQS